jgi:eukaryotic-like serine/threonine-protein kinase
MYHPSACGALTLSTSPLPNDIMATQKTVPAATRWIWPFELIEQIGEGGMGVVYRARYVVNNREVALKMLPGDVTDKVALARFERELEVLKNLKHPNIVRCFGGVSEDKQRFYAMELVEGGSLEDELQRRGKLSMERVVAYGLQMCAALECSHKNGVIHRDIKPSNFLIGNDRQLKLSDFGLASVSASRRITAAGKTAGTLLYMAPEQIRGGDLSPQTDLYALGCVFYELLTGKPPFVGESPAQTMHMHCKSEIPRVSQVILDCPAVLDKLIAKLMAKDPSQRPQSAAEVARELRAVTNTITVKIDPKRMLLEGGGSSPAALPPVMRTDLDDGAAPPYRRSFRDTITLCALLAALVGSLLYNFSRKPDSELTTKLETQWVNALRHPDRVVRVTAAKSLGELNGQSLVALKALANSLEDFDPSVRREAILAVAKAGTPGRTYIPSLMRINKDDRVIELRNLAGMSIKTLKEAPDDSYLGTWLLLLGLAATVGGATYYWLHRTVKLDEMPRRKPVLGVR